MSDARDRFRETVAAHPDWYGARIARHIGVSRERVRQIAQSEGVTLARIVAKPKPPRIPRQPATVCKRGHLLAGNMYPWDTHRRCRTCMRTYAREAKRAMKLAGPNP